ncbi:MAG: hypothetical protein ACI9VR_003414 [Cognaticolwellia sp.]|jgi:hypothetical protein
MLLLLVSLASAHSAHVGVLTTGTSGAVTDRLGVNAEVHLVGNPGLLRVRGVILPLSEPLSGAGLIGVAKSLPIKGAWSFAPGLDVSRGVLKVESLGCNTGCTSLSLIPKGTLMWAGDQWSVAGSLGLSTTWASITSGSLNLAPALRLGVTHSSGGWVQAERGEIRDFSAVSAGWSWSF